MVWLLKAPPLGYFHLAKHNRESSLKNTHTQRQQYVKPTAFQSGHSSSGKTQAGVGGGRPDALVRTPFLNPLHSSAHQAGKHRHHHLGFHLHQVFGKRVDAGTDSSSHGHSVPACRTKCQPKLSYLGEMEPIQVCSILEI